jgi:hypothetical protein
LALWCAWQESNLLPIAPQAWLLLLQPGLNSPAAVAFDTALRGSGCRRYGNLAAGGFVGTLGADCRVAHRNSGLKAGFPHKENDDSQSLDSAAT